MPLTDHCSISESEGNHFVRPLERQKTEMAKNNILLPILFSTIAFCIAVFCAWIAYTNPRLIVRRWSAADLESAKTETVAAGDAAVAKEVVEGAAEGAPAG